MQHLCQNQMLRFHTQISNLSSQNFLKMKVILVNKQVVDGKAPPVQTACKVEGHQSNFTLNNGYVFIFIIIFYLTGDFTQTFSLQIEHTW